MITKNNVPTHIIGTQRLFTKFLTSHLFQISQRNHSRNINDKDEVKDCICCSIRILKYIISSTAVQWSRYLSASVALPQPEQPTTERKIHSNSITRGIVENTILSIDKRMYIRDTTITVCGLYRTTVNLATKHMWTKVCLPSLRDEHFRRNLKIIL